MSNLIGPSAVAKRVGVTRQTIHSWTDIYSELLSDESDPGVGKNRHYTPFDALVLRQIKKERDRDRSLSHAETLDLLRDIINRGELADQVDSYTEQELSDLAIKDAHIMTLQAQIQMQGREIQRLEILLKNAQVDLDKLIAAKMEIGYRDGIIQELRRQLDETS